MLYPGRGMIIAHMNSCSCGYLHRSRQLKIPAHREVQLRRLTFTQGISHWKVMVAERGRVTFLGRWQLQECPCPSR